MVFISSTGRTGTQFLADSLSEMIPQCRSVHEPGTLWLTKPKLFLENIKDFGLYHMSLGQLNPKYSMYTLSNLRAKGKISDDEAIHYIRKMRSHYIEKGAEELYIESSGHLFGVFDLIPQVFPDSKLIFIIRDPRNWVASALPTTEYILYGSFDWGLSVSAEDLKEDPYHDKWHNMNKFEKYCWWYNYLNRFVMERCKNLPNIRIYRFEDLFSKETKDGYFTNMLQYAVDGSSMEGQTYYDSNRLTKPKHSKKNSRNYQGWRQWGRYRVSKLMEHCSEFMLGYGYGGEDLWVQKLEKIDPKYRHFTLPQWFSPFYRIQGLS